MLHVVEIQNLMNQHLIHTLDSSIDFYPIDKRSGIGT